MPAFTGPFLERGNEGFGEAVMGRVFNERRPSRTPTSVLRAAAAVDVVTADGELVRCDSEQNADLFWAVRGSGPGFPGIVVRFHLRKVSRGVRSPGGAGPGIGRPEPVDSVAEAGEGLW